MENEELTPKEEKKAKKTAKQLGKKAGAIFTEFRKFISKGNVVDMAVGVVVGAAFSAIITALVQGIIMPLITLAIPSGGIDGLVTVLNHSKAIATETTDPANIITYWGVNYDKNIVNVINWGTFINAVLYFLIVALILFIIMKTYTTLKKKGDSMVNASLEKYYQKHPEERPAPVEKKPTETELLAQILEELKKKEK